MRGLRSWRTLMVNLRTGEGVDALLRGLMEAAETG